MSSRMICIVLAIFSVSAIAAPSLDDLMAQNRCTQVNGKINSYDCMVDQSDGSVKKVRYFKSLGQRHGTAKTDTQPSAAQHARE